jgi:hypothetical protein
MSPTKAAYWLCGIILVILVAQWSLPERLPEVAPPEPTAECKGDPITVEYPFNGTMVEPHACKPQCADGKQRYILYTNGVATQCSDPPSCLDWGEDHGETCIVPLKTPTS